MGMTEETTNETTRLTLRPAYLVGVTIVLLVAVCITLFFLADSGGNSEVRHPVAATTQTAPPSPTEGGAPPQGAAPGASPAQDPAAIAEDNEGQYHGYEESLGAPLERLVRKVDFALMESLILTGYGPGHLEFTEISLRRFHGEAYHYQALTIELDSKPQRFITTLERALAKWAPVSKLVREHDESGAQRATVMLMGRPTHTLTFTITPAKSPEDLSEGKLAIVIDDMGQSANYAKKLAQLPYPVTFSILPHMARATQVARIAHEAGLDILLHLPMEPKGYPGVRPGPGALFTTMDQRQILATLHDDLRQVPEAIGVNNHMGSKFTQDTAGMATVMGELHNKGMFFLDSLTTPGSVAMQEGRNAGLALYKRNIFLDNIRDVRSIRRQLEKAQRLAASRGQAIAIGHPYPETLKALQEWGQRTNRTARMVPLTALQPIR